MKLRLNVSASRAAATRLGSLTKRLARLVALPVLGSTLAMSGCGKEDNIHDVMVLDFPHSFPEAPRPLDTARATPDRTGHPLVATDSHLFLLDRDNRELVRLDRRALDAAKTKKAPGAEREASVRLGGKPEQLVRLDSGDMLVTLRTTGEVLRVTPDLQITQRLRLGVDAYGIALSPDGRTAYVTLPLNGELVTIDAITLEELDRATLIDTPRGVTASTNHYLLVTQEHGPATRIEIDESGLPLDTLHVHLRPAPPAELISSGRLHLLKPTRALAAATHPVTGAAFVAHVTAAPGSDDVTSGNVRIPDGSSSSSDGYGGSSLNPGSFNVPVRPVEVAAWVPPAPAQMVDTRPDRPQVIQSFDVFVDSELRARIRLLSVEELPDNGAQMVWQYTVERKGSDRPVCVAESISRRYA